MTTSETYDEPGSCPCLADARPGITQSGASRTEKTVGQGVVTARPAFDWRRVTVYVPGVENEWITEGVVPWGEPSPKSQSYASAHPSVAVKASGRPASILLDVRRPTRRGRGTCRRP